ncbi:MAG: hypothetical protein E6K18_08030 [Methanobacteriota archaeon]|nr:MAG: hypothetical protein E6K18_08030 [Euryarchaeota archaeon]
MKAPAMPRKLPVDELEEMMEYAQEEDAFLLRRIPGSKAKPWWSYDERYPYTREANVIATVIVSGPGSSVVAWTITETGETIYLPAEVFPL